MVTFLDGPAIGKSLMLRRAPLFLRVVEDCYGQFDALDRIEDKPTPTEAIYVYQLASDAHPYHIHGKQLNGWYVNASYRLYKRQPGERVRDTKAWQMFAEGQAKLCKTRPRVANAENKEEPHDDGSD